MVPWRISTHRKRRGPWGPLDLVDRREGEPGQRRNTSGTKPAQHSGRHSAHVAIQATKSEVHAPDIFRNSANHVRKARSNNQLKGFPMMNTKSIRKHLPPSLATPKGRMKRPRGEIRSTRRERKDEFEKNWKSNWF